MEKNIEAIAIFVHKCLRFRVRGIYILSRLRIGRPDATMRLPGATSILTKSLTLAVTLVSKSNKETGNWHLAG